jgi:hypothetical protein
MSRWVDISHTIASLVFFQEVEPGDVIETTADSGAAGYYWRKGAKGLVLRDDDDSWYVEFRYQGNPSMAYLDTGGALAGRFFVPKDGCKLVSKA